MITYPHAVKIDGAWVGVGGNTPFPEFRNLHITKIELRDSEEFNAALILVTFDNDEILRVRTNEYMVRYKSQEDTQ